MLKLRRRFEWDCFHASPILLLPCWLWKTCYALQILGMPDNTRHGDCPQKAALVEDIRVAIKSILEIHNRQLERVLAGDFSTGDDTEKHLKIAREAKNVIIERYREHVMSHGC